MPDAFAAVISECRVNAPIEKTVANSPDALQSPHSDSPSYALKEGYLASQFVSKNSNSVTLNLGSSGVLAYSLDNTDHLVHRSIPSPHFSLSLRDLI